MYLGESVVEALHPIGLLLLRLARQEIEVGQNGLAYDRRRVGNVERLLGGCPITRKLHPHLAPNRDQTERFVRPGRDDGLEPVRCHE